MKIEQHDTTCVVVKEGAKYLLMKRATPPETGFWCFPGGHVDEGETVRQCAEREAREEAGEIKVEEKPFYIFEHDPKLFHRHRCHVFFGRLEGNLNPNDESSDIGFFPLAEIRGLSLTHFTVQIINRMAEAGLLDRGT